ncbi:hypothetical protein PsorP6_002528 [Peronosclerospora sorghi]|uniref:Uncharacterized protein n=1 Tax=Peronosclerospora sorghi TaxID=230839 RepID=A0ACC0WVL2_9STRA|nr:hypothetical protein PsorP6_002528 [Peronosclerospora sorghi]
MAIFRSIVYLRGDVDRCIWSDLRVSEKAKRKEGRERRQLHGGSEAGVEEDAVSLIANWQVGVAIKACPLLYFYDVEDARSSWNKGSEMTTLEMAEMLS